MIDRQKNIVIGIDDSEQAKWALAAGADLASSLDARVILVHVIVPPIAGVSEVPVDVGAIRQEMQTAAAAMLEEARWTLPVAVHGETVVREGSPPRQIVAVAEEVGASYIVLGTHGRGRLAAFILGSTAEAVIREARCPVVAVSHAPVSNTHVAHENSSRLGVAQNAGSALDS